MVFRVWQFLMRSWVGISYFLLFYPLALLFNLDVEDGLFVGLIGTHGELNA